MLVHVKSCSYNGEFCSSFCNSSCSITDGYYLAGAKITNKYGINDKPYADNTHCSWYFRNFAIFQYSRILVGEFNENENVQGGIVHSLSSGKVAATPILKSVLSQFSRFIL